MGSFPHRPRLPWSQFALAGRDGHPFTAPVASFPPDAFGLHDMHGNVWEWVVERHADDYYARCAFRNWNSPETRYTLVGVRLAMEAEHKP